MNSIISASSFIPSLSCKFTPSPQLQSLYINSHHDHHQSSLHSVSFPFITYSSFPSCKSLKATIPSNEGTVSVINFEDFIEKDWSFLDSDNFNSEQDQSRIFHQIISSGRIKENSRVLASIPSEGFVDQLVESAPKHDLLVVHDSLLPLVCIKEKYDKVKCWQGELIYVPEKWTPFDVVFLYYLPGLPFELDLIFEALSERCLPGARIVISHPRGREALEQQREMYSDIVVSDLPDKTTLEKAAADRSFGLVEFQDKAEFYLVVLNFQDKGN